LANTICDRSTFEFESRAGQKHSVSECTGQFMVSILLAFSAISSFQDAPVATPARVESNPVRKRTISPADMKKWELLGPALVSKDGRWVMGQINLVDGDGRLEIRNSDDARKWTVPLGRVVGFSDDSKWAAYVIGHPQAEVDRAREQQRPLFNKLGLRHLESGNERILDNVQTPQFLTGGRYLVARRNDTRQGTDFTIWDLEQDSELSINSVSDFRLNEPQNLIALQVTGRGGENGIQIFDPATQSLRTVVWNKGPISALQWARKADVLGFLRGKEDSKKEGASYEAVLASDLKSSKPKLIVFEPAKTEGFPKDHRISEFGSVQLSEDGKSITFGIATWRDRVAPDRTRPDERSNVEVWNSKDVRPIPQQKRSLESDRRETHLSVWNSTSGRFLQLESHEMETAAVLPGFRYARVIDEKPYASPVSDGNDYQDIYLVDLSSGEWQKIREKVLGSVNGSRTGKYLTYWDGNHWWLLDLSSGGRTNVTDRAGVSFRSETYDSIAKLWPPAGNPVWLADDAGALFFDEYDAWLWTPGSRLKRLTDGRKTWTSFRLTAIELQRDGQRLSDPMYFSVTGERDKRTGIHVVRPDGTRKTLLLDNVIASGFSRAGTTDRLAFRLSAFDKSPAFYITNLEFSQAKPVLTTNAQQDQFYWGKSQLVEYKSRWGVPLQGALVYPANYVPGRKYPMVFYIYERVSDALNQYSPPVEHSAYNHQVLSQNGYFVYLADIAYRPSNPGISAVECLEPALDAALKLNVGIDSSKIGIMGHSWGAYQTAFVTSVSKRFHVGACGAPLTELTSMYNSFYWNAGITNQVIFESSQGRMEKPFWDDFNTYVKNSPVHRSKERTAPILVAFGDQDGAVDWSQGQQLYNTLRRMGKETVLLVYPGENHGLARRANQLDYARRLRHWFDVYLKGVKAEPWVSEGIPWMKQAPPPAAPPGPAVAGGPGRGGPGN
jgi:dipeptidyl aminopeptidase/acylaminoacyl peptidase